MEIKGRPKDRHSATGMAGSPKKGGGGGKGTWGVGGMDDLKTVSVSDNRDPNYDSEDEDVEEVVITRTEITTPIEVVIKDFLASGDVDETIKSLKELKIDNVHDQFIKKSMVFAMERKAFERELVSKLISSIYNVAVSADKIADGFQAALNSLEDLVLDTPDAVDLLAKFLARAIIDEVIPPSFLKNAIAESPLAEQCLASANTLTNQPFRSERLAHIWGAGDLNSVKRLKEEIILLFEEYLTNGDQHEADQSLRELNVPHFHPRLVKQSLRLALTKDEEQKKKILSLLAYFAKTELISRDHIKMGFNYCLESLEDLKLDVPNAPIEVSKFIQTAKSEGWLDSSLEEVKV